MFAVTIPIASGRGSILWNLQACRGDAESGGDDQANRDRRLAALAVAALAFRSGGYFPSEWGLIAMACLLAIVAVGFSPIAT